MATVRRHWVVAVACLVATVAVAAVVYLRVPVYYTTQTQLVVLSPAARADSNGDLVAFNPYLTAGDGPSQVMASALQRVAVSPSFEVALANRGVSSEYSVAVATSGGGVVLEVVTVALNPTTALNDLNTASKLLNETLVKQQLDAGSPENQLLTMRDLVGPSQPSPLPGDRMKLAGIAAVLGLVLTGLMLTVLTARSRRAPAVPLPPASTAPAAGAPPTPSSSPALTPAQSGSAPSGGEPAEHNRRRTDRSPGRRDDPQRRAEDLPNRADEPQPVRGQRRPEEPTTPQRPPGEARRPDDQRRRPSDVEETVAMPKVTAEALRNAAERSRGPAPGGPAVVPGGKPGGPLPKGPGSGGPGVPGAGGPGPGAGGPGQNGPGQSGPVKGPGQNGPVPVPKWPEQQPTEAGR